MKAKDQFSFSDYQTLIIPNFFEPIRYAVRRQKRLLSNVNKAYHSYYERIKRIDSANKKSKLINESKWLKESLYQLLENEFPEINSNTLEDTFVSFEKQTKEFLKNIELSQKEEQVKERFISQSEDSPLLKVKKQLKQFFFYCSRIPNYIFRAFSSEKKRITRWSHKIPLRAMHQHFFINRFLTLNLPIFEELQKLRCEALNVKWEIDKDINQAFDDFLKSEHEIQELIDQIEVISNKERIINLISNFDRKIKVWEKESINVLKDLHQQFLDEKKKVNTIELSRKKFSTPRLNEEINHYQTKFQKINNGWRNTLFAQIDDFQTDIELYQIKFVSLIQFSLLQNSFKSRLTKTTTTYIDKIDSELDHFSELLNREQGETDESKLIQKLKSERKNIHQNLEQQLIPQSIEAIYNQNFPNLLERLEVRIEEQIDKMKNRRLIYAKDIYDQPINKSELNHFNPKKLVKIDLFAQFNSALKSIKSSMIHRLEKIELELKDLSGIANYNLNTAVNSDDEELEENSPLKIINEGIERTQSKLKSIEEQLWLIEKTLAEELEKVVFKFNKGLIQLTLNENITQLRIQLAKAEAYQTTSNLGQRIIVKLKESLPLAQRFSRLKYLKINKIANKYATKIGIIETSKEISAELSDFLAQTEMAIAKLPFVYRRLYRIKPTEEEVFFEGREEEIKTIETAYKNWQENAFSSTVIIGEKGSGASSLVNFFLKSIPENSKTIIRKKMIESKFSAEDFISFFKTLLNKKDLENFDDIVKELNSGNYKIIILEDLQHFYMKKIHGFEAMNMLFELISASEKNIFWLVEFTTYAWNYLNRTMEINRYFKTIVPLKKMTDEQMVNIIMKRHRVSGYDIRFDVNHFSESEKKKAAKLSLEKREDYLKNQYFKALNSFAESNISLALLYWLRSTIKVEDNTIVIGQLKNLNFNFIDALSKDSIFGLHALLLHDSLSTKEHALIFNTKEHESRLNLMVLEDKGILQSDGDRFHINRLLYRQVVNVLQRKNILH